ncbi:YcaO-like family protein [Roseateles sp. MS654]|uniref:YcaO-like family protein n=1 Tax=Roseateles sp. MS654 TaxID=3412685 RepID=UPI003C2F3848
MQGENNRRIGDWISSVAVESDSLPFSGKFRNATVKGLARRLNPRSFGVTRVSSVGGFDAFGISVVQAARPNVSSKQITSTQGSGTLLGAYCSAIMEAAERDAAANIGDRILSTYENLVSQGKPVADVSSFFLRLDPRSEVLWVPCDDVFRGTKVLAPASLFHFPVLEGYLPSIPNTTGIAAGSTILEAATYAAFEVVERFYVSLSQFGYLRPRPIIGKLPKFATEILASLAEKAYDVILLKIDPSPIAVVIGVIRDRSGLTSGAVYRESAAHASLTHAINSVVKALAQSVVTAIQGAREDMSRVEAGIQSDLEESDRVWATVLEGCGEDFTMQDIVEQEFPNVHSMAVHTFEAIYDFFSSVFFFRDISQNAEAKVASVVFPLLVDGMIESARMESALERLRA